MGTLHLESFCLSIQQAHLWSLQKKNRSLCAISIQGWLHRRVLQEVLACLVDRHEILRTCFSFMSDMGIPVQAIADTALCVCPVISLEGLGPSLQHEKIDALIASMQEKEVDLEHVPALSTYLIHLSLEDHVLLFSLPTLCADASTLRLFVAELQQTYSSYPQMDESGDEPLQYADVSAWQDGLLLEETAAPQVHYWEAMDLSQLVTTPLPFGRAYAVYADSAEEKRGNTFIPQILEVPLSEMLSRQIETQAQQYDISVSSWLLACWQVLLWRLGNQAHFLVGVACDGRIYEDLAQALGVYSRFVPMSVHFEGELSFEQVLLEVDRSLQEACERQMYFTWEAPKGGQLFFPMSFEYESWPASFTSKTTAFSLYRCFACIEPFSLKLSVLHIGEHLQLTVQYDQQKMTSAQVQHIACMLHTLLHSAVTQSRTPINQLSILIPDEQKYVLDTFKGQQRPLPVQLLHQLFEAHVARTPHQQAIIDAQEVLTYEQLNRRANQLARVLRRRGVGPNVLVALCVARSVQMIVNMLAILKAGGAYVPLDPLSPPTRLAFQLQDTQVSLLITQQEFSQYFSGWEGTLLCVDAMTEVAQQEIDSNVSVMSNAQDLAYIMYTSGSTGMPKGVMIAQQSVVNYTLAVCELLKCEPGWQYATVSTLAADLGNTAIFCALASGGCLQVLDYDTITSGEVFARWIAQHPIDVLKIVPSHLSALLAGEQAITPRRALILGGEALPFGLLERLLNVGSTCAVYNHYGPTETTIGVLVNPLGDLRTLDVRIKREGESGIVPLGQPIPNCEAYVLDRGLEIMPVGAEGELYLGGVGLAIGYLHNVEQTAERFIPHPFSNHGGARLYRTGDLARYISSERIDFLGRYDNQVKLRGYRIELKEIEAVLRHCPMVQDAVVVLRKDIPAEPFIVGYVVSQQKATLTGQRLDEFVRESLPEYMVPSTYVFLESLPFTTNGKLDRQRLPKPNLMKNDVPAVPMAPRNPIEEILLNIWKDLLPVSKIGIHDNFFHLGGHSLLVMRVVSQIRVQLQIDLPILSLFEAPTVVELAVLIERKLRGEHSTEIPPLVAVARTQNLPLSFAQQRLWFLAQLERESCTFNKHFALRLRGRLHVEALADSLGKIIQRHEILRTTYHVVEGQPVQIIRQQGSLLFSIIDISNLLFEECEQATRELISQETLHAFHLASGPLWRTMLLRLTQDEHVLVVSTHHITSDAWSNDVFARDLVTLYTAFVTGETALLPLLSVQYADFAVWQRQWLQGDVFDTQLRYWTKQLGGLVPLKLPIDHQRSRRQTFRGAHLDMQFTALLSNDLKMLSQQDGVTLFMTLLAAFQVLLSAYSGQDDVVVGTDVANRNRAEIEDLIGFFVNQLILRTDLSGDLTFRELLGRVRTTTLQAYAHQDLPFEKLVEVLNPKRSTQLSPFFQVKIVWQNAVLEPRTLPGITIHPLAADDTGSAKLDLVLFLSESTDGLQGSFVYNTDLFSTTTMSDYAKHLALVLENIAAQPDIKLDTLKRILSKEQEPSKMEPKLKKENSFHKLKTIKPKVVSLNNENLMQMDLLQPESTLPLVIRPQSVGLDLIEWAKNNVPLLETTLLKHGALLFRDFDISSPEIFESFAATICPTLFGENSEHPREAVSENVYTPVFYPPEKKLLWHNENSFNAIWPMKIWFFCGKPAEWGGETPIVDSRKVFEILDPAIREQFVRKNVMYVRNYGDGLGLHWSTVFRTKQKSEVEAYCREAAIEFEWKDGDRLRTQQIRPAVLKHPKTDEYIWWNQATHWHPACLEPEIRDSLSHLFAEEDFPRNCYYGDGSPIESAAMQAICDVYQEIEISFPWQQGDILMLDNMLTAHARNPFKGQRKIYVSMGEMISLNDIQG